jgi:deoxynucleoside kinase
MKLISIEGNIGSGKSTFVEELKRNIHNERVCFLEEPVDIWNTIVDKDGITMLENYYKDSKKYAFSFQMMAYISRLSILKKAIESGKYDVIITERSLYTDKHVFCQMLYDNKLIEHLEFIIYNKWFEEFNIIQDIQYVYLKTDPQVSYERVLKRSRVGETIPLAYLENCSQYHDKWLLGKDVLLINANIENTGETVNKWIKLIRQIL